MNVGSTGSMQGYGMQTRMSPPTSEEMLSKIMQDVDVDGDGTISSEELEALDEKQQQKLAEADSNGDGVITEDELLTKIAEHIAEKGQMGPPSAADLVSRILEDADTDGDGSISAEELSAVDEKHQQKLAEADTDGDGIITEEELTAQVSEDMASRAPMRDMTLNGFKELLASLSEAETTVEDTATQIETYLGDLGLSETEISDFMTLLENRRFDIKA